MKKILLYFVLLYAGNICFSQLAAPLINQIPKGYKQIEINGVKAIKTPAHKTLYQLSKDVEIPLSRLRKYNEFNPKADIIYENEIIYLEPKRIKSKEYAFYVLSNRSTLREVSKDRAVRLKCLLNYNQQYSADQELSSGVKIFLRP